MTTLPSLAPRAKHPRLPSQLSSSSNDRPPTWHEASRSRTEPADIQSLSICSGFQSIKSGAIRNPADLIGLEPTLRKTERIAADPVLTLNHPESRRLRCTECDRNANAG